MHSPIETDDSFGCLSDAERANLRHFVTRYNAEGRFINCGMSEAEAKQAVSRLLFMRWRYRTGRLTD